MTEIDFSRIFSQSFGIALLTVGFVEAGLTVSPYISMAVGWLLIVFASWLGMQELEK